MDTATFSTKLQDLNEYCLRHIFQYLSFEDQWRFYKVCSKWTHVSPGFWRISQFGVVDIRHRKKEEHPDLMMNRKLNFEQFQEIILTCGPTFQKLLIWLGFERGTSGKRVYSFDGTAFFIDGEFSYEATLDILVETCRDLKTLKIYACESHHLHLAEKFHALFLANEKLVEVHLNCNTAISLNNIVRLKDVPEPAKRLYLSISQSFFDTNVNIICDLLESNKVNLKSLSFTNDNIIVASRLVQAVVNHAKELECFEMLCSGTKRKTAALGNRENMPLGWDENIIDEIMFAITDGCKKLKEVKLLTSSPITNECTNTLMTSLPALESVVLTGLNITEIIQSDAQWTIQRLVVNFCRNISENEFKKISVFRNLEELSISGGYKTMTDGVIVAISVGCRKLKKFDLNFCNAITNEGLNILMTALPMLESVLLAGLTVTSIIHNDSQTRVKSLGISCCNNLSKDALKKITLFKNLEVLHMYDMKNFTDEVLSTISYACKKLKTFDVSFMEDCTTITSEGVNTLVSALPHLESLELILLCLGSTLPTDLQESNLQRLKIWYYGSFSDREWETILSKMPKLKHADINELQRRCINIT